MTMLVHYNSKKLLKAAIGQLLRYSETSLFGEEFRSDGWLTVAHRPHMTGRGREFFSRVFMSEGRIAKVE